METIGQLWQEGNQIRRNKPCSGNYNEVTDKERIASWSKRCLSFLVEMGYLEDVITRFEIASENLGVNEMMGMIKEFCKHQEELVVASPVIKLLGYNRISFEMCDDSPDIVLPSRKVRLRGIEVTNYLHGDNIIEEKNHLCNHGYSVREETDIDYNLLSNRIHDKEIKLNDYKANIKNNTIKEYILVINVPSAELIDIKRCVLPKDITTHYDKIYIVDVEQYKQIL